MILNSKGNQILSNVSQDEFKRVISTVQDAILATDLAVYFKRRKDTFALLESGEMDFQNDNHRLGFSKELPGVKTSSGWTLKKMSNFRR